ncbi:hypothetical protein ACIQKA_28815 [Streptomyces sp. NPDC092045]|uniref:hypothetical protein n=2 Tax=unclassified Streptomyces TaxID=2593676 RepID=UPI0037F91284
MRGAAGGLCCVSGAATIPAAEPMSVRSVVWCSSTGCWLRSRTCDTPFGAVTRYERDVFGRAVRITDALGHATRPEWTTEGRLARRVELDGADQAWTYDGEGDCVHYRDALGGVTAYEYSHFDVLTALNGPDGARHEFDHDTELRLLSFTNPQGPTWT